MSLLNRGTDVVTVFSEEVIEDADGNAFTRPSAVGIVCKAVVQPLSMALVNANAETQEGGFLTTTKYRLRLVGWKGAPLGAQSAVEWRGKRYVIEGDPRVYRSSRRTAHVDYVMVSK